MVFTWRRANPLGRASPLCREPVICLYDEGSLPWRDLAIDYQRSRLGGLEIFHINAFKRAGPPRRASSVHTTKFVLASIVLGNFSFYKFVYV